MFLRRLTNHLESHHGAETELRTASTTEGITKDVDGLHHGLSTFLMNSVRCERCITIVRDGMRQWEPDIDETA